jgi:hypothetical protein
MLDATSSSTGTTAGPSWTHTPSGTPNGVLVFIVQLSDGDDISGVTYGGVAMEEVSGSPVIRTADGAVYAYFLGSGVPSGAQTVTATVNGLSKTKYGVAISVRTTGGSARVSGVGTLDTNVDDPVVSFSVSTLSFVAAAMWNGNAGVGSIEADTGFQNIHEINFGLSSGGWIYRVGNASGSVTAEWTSSAAADVAAIGVGITSAQNVAPPFLNYAGQTFAPAVYPSGVYAPFLNYAASTYAPAVKRAVSPPWIDQSGQTFAPTVIAAIAVSPPFLGSSVAVYTPVVSTLVTDYGINPYGYDGNRKRVYRTSTRVNSSG